MNNGFVVINKPKGITSFGCIREARKKLNTRKIGHLGTLDPNATGVLVLAVNNGTKLVEYLMSATKSYRGDIVLGAESNTYDVDGEITEHKVEVPPTREEIEASLKTFLGKSQQLPPKYSAVKVKGQRACDIMRRGGDVELKPKEVEITKLEIVSYEWPKLVINMDCSSGTYVRSLAHDLGQKLGCGAYLGELVRTMVGHFALEGAIELDDLTPEDIRDTADMVADWPRWEIPMFVYGRLRNGLSVAVPQNSDLPKFKLLAVYCEGEFRGIAEWIKGGKFLRFKKQIFSD